MKRKFTALILAALCAATSSVCLSACNFGNTPTTPVPPTSSGSEDEEQQPSKPALTFDGFIKNHKSAAVKFFEDFIYADVVGNRSVKAENGYLNDKDGDNKVESAAMCYIYCLNETERAIEVANITFAPVNVQDIVDGKVTALNLTVSRNTVFTFDAKENYENQDLATALYDTAKVTTDTMLFNEEVSPSSSYRQFTIVNMTDSNNIVTYVSAKKGDGTKETLLENLAKNPIVQTKYETKLDGALLKSTAYTLETFEEEQPPVNPNPPEEPDDPVTVTNAEIIAALDENCIDGILNNAFPWDKTNKANIVDGTWYLTKDDDNNITKAEYAYNYQMNDIDIYYLVTEVNFTTPLTSQNIKDKNLNNVTYSTRYRSTKSYNPTIQDSYAELTQVICNKAFGESDNAIRYIIDNGGGNDRDLGLTRSFTVIQIENGNVKEATIIIKNDSAGYIANVQNGKHKDITYGKSYNLSGEKLVAE